MQTMISYFRELASAVGLTTGDDEQDPSPITDPPHSPVSLDPPPPDEKVNLLEVQYDRLRVHSDTVLPSYLCPDIPLLPRSCSSRLIYPFGINLSQKTAVENAFRSQVSIIQGPPGTGKTQTILNIIANIVLQNKTVAVVSANNLATSNVIEKLSKYDLDFLGAFLGNNANKRQFLRDQTGKYPDMQSWVLDKQSIENETSAVSMLEDDLTHMLEIKNSIAKIDVELLNLDTERKHFDRLYAQKVRGNQPPDGLQFLSPKKLLWAKIEMERLDEMRDSIGILVRVRAWFYEISIWLKYGASVYSLCKLPADQAVLILQRQYYIATESNLRNEKDALESYVSENMFSDKLSDLSKKSMRLLKAILARRFPWHNERKRFGKINSPMFLKEYPLILSSTYSLSNVFDDSVLYDYLIIDEASQVDLATAVLAFSRAKNVVIVGDQQQLPNVVTAKNKKESTAILKEHSVNDTYSYSLHSVLSSSLLIWPSAPSVLLREHYRSHPKIVGFFNEKFYNGQLIPLTKDSGESDVLSVIQTSVGNHARDRYNQRQIDVILAEALPHLHQSGIFDIGIIAPYRKQVHEIERQLGTLCDISTVHKFQGREKPAIILSTVDNVISPFVDNYKFLNVAVSRAIRSLVVVISQDPRNERTNYGDLVKYINYNNLSFSHSHVHSVFDLLYKANTQQRKDYLKKYKRISEYDSENLMSTILENILSSEAYTSLGVAHHVSLSNIFQELDNLSQEESAYVSHPWAHVDFLIFFKMNKEPALAIEVDGYAFHKKGTVQADRDAMKNMLFQRIGIPILRFQTNQSGEESRLKVTLNQLPLSRFSL
jgi:DNA polymerase III delta prime subunit